MKWINKIIYQCIRKNLWISARLEKDGISDPVLVVELYWDDERIDKTSVIMEPGS